MTQLSHRSLRHKGKTDFRPSEREIQKAEEIIRQNIGEWPEDDWYILSPDVDLNLYTSSTKRGPVKRAAVYPVTDEGRTVTRTWFRLFIQEALNDGTNETTTSN